MLLRPGLVMDMDTDKFKMPADIRLYQP